MGFTGRYRHTIDAKGRLIFPSRLRSEMEDNKVLLMPSPDQCIAVWSGEDRRSYEESLKSQAKADRQKRALLRELYSSSHTDEVDKQNRISIPDELRESMGIDREVVILGSGDHVEIWDPERYEQHRQETVVQVGLDTIYEQLDI